MTRLEFVVPVKELYPDIHVVLSFDTVNRAEAPDLDLFFVNHLAELVAETLKNELDRMIEAHAALELAEQEEK